MNDTTGVPHESHQSLFALEHKWTEFDEFTWAQDELELINLFQKGDDVDDGDSFKWTQEGYKLVSSPIDSRNTTKGITFLKKKTMPYFKCKKIVIEGEY